jgi:glutathione S-transferase
MYRLYYSPGLASLAPHFVLREIGVEFELVAVERSIGQHKSPEYLALNPNGRIPTFTDGAFVLFESAAICLHLADKHPEAGLVAKTGTDRRGHTYQWLTFLTNTLQADLWQYYRPEFYVDQQRRDEFRTIMEQHVARHLAILDDYLERNLYLAGDEISIADFYLLMLGRWSRNISRPTRMYLNLSRLMERICNRASVRTAFEVEKISAPYY